MAQKIHNMVLPQFRGDIEVYRGPDDKDGSPTYNLYDPVRVQYFRITWAETTILKFLKPRITLFELMHEVYTRTTLKVSPEEVLAFFEDASKNGLIVTHKSSRELMSELRRQKVHPIKWLLVHYLYMRLPLVHPDKFLAKMIPYVRPLMSPVALLVYLLFTAAGLVVVFTNVTEYIGTFTYFFNLQGVLAYILAITCVKIIHELSHAFVAKRYGLHIPVIGVAFIVLWPVLFTDVTDGWRLKNRKQRFAVSIAGVCAELLIAGVSTLGWALSEPGLMQSLFFIVSSTTWISTLLMNLNPFMRFDGYYLLCDLWGIDNLQPRAFAMMRWQAIRTFLGLELQCPEEGFSRGHQVGLVLYSIATWAYRVFLYTAIALFIYFRVGRALGMTLFVLEIGIFLLLPLVQEVIFINRLRSRLTMNWRSLTTTALVILLGAWFVLPFPHSQGFPAIVVPQDLQTVHVLNNGVVTAEYVKKGDNVVKGQPLALTYSEKLYNLTAQLEIERQTLLAEIINLSNEEAKKKDQLGEKIAEMVSVEAQLQAFQQEKLRGLLTASIDGEVFWWDQDLLNRPVKKGQVLGKIASPRSQWEVLVYVPENYIVSVKPGNDVTFAANNGAWRISGNVLQVSPSRTIQTDYVQLTSIDKGKLPAVKEAHSNKAKLIESYYEVRVAIDKDEDLTALRMGQTGTGLFRSQWYSMCYSLFKKAAATIWQESTF